jgi:hypothetical protein
MWREVVRVFSGIAPKPCLAWVLREANFQSGEKPVRTGEKSEVGFEQSAVAHVHSDLAYLRLDLVPIGSSEDQFKKLLIGSRFQRIGDFQAFIVQELANLAIVSFGVLGQHQRNYASQLRPEIQTSG